MAAELQQRLYDAAVLHDVELIDTPTPTAALRRIYDAFTRTGSNEHTVAAIGVPRYSCSHSLKRVERVLLQPRRLYFSSLHFCNLSNPSCSRNLKDIAYLNVLYHIYLATIEIAYANISNISCVENAGEKNV